MMKRIVFCLLFSLLAFSARAQEVNTQQEPQTITIGERFFLASEILGEERAYLVYLPASYNDSTYAPQRYPVLYLLDGGWHFQSASGVVQFMSTGINGNIQIPELIIVAITNTNRTRDLTPTHTKIGYSGEESASLEASGGGDRFLQFVRDELFPEIESTYRTQPYRILVGHSLGGLLALHALLDAPGMFQSYIAIDPSLWWDDQLLVHRAARHFTEARELRGSVYISLANNPDIGFGDPMAMEEKPGQTFARSLEAAASSDFRSTLQYFEAEDHGSVPLLSLYHGLLYIFEGYKPSLAALFEDPSALRPHFERISERLGVVLLPPEAFVNRLGYAMLRQIEDVDKAIELFKLNVSNFPGSYNAYDSLGEAYMVKDEKALAIENYEKSLELNPANQNAEERLQALRSQGEH